MKKYLILTLLAILTVLIIPYRAYSIDIQVGATLWNPYMDRYTERSYDGYTAKIRYDQTFLYGPAMSVKFNDDFNLTFIYLYGKFDKPPLKAFLPGLGAVDYEDIKRKDSDLALNYRLSDYFKVLAG